MTCCAFVRVCYATLSLQHSLQTSHDVQRDIQAEKHRDMPAEHHRDARGSFADFVHREVRTQLTNFLNGSIDPLMMRHPYVVTYYSELTTLCLHDAVMGDELFVPLLTLCLGSSLYDIRLAALQFLAGILDRTGSVQDDADDGDDDGFFPPDISNDSTESLRVHLLSKLMVDNCRGLCQLLVDMLLHTELHDECLVMVSLLSAFHTCNCFSGGLKASPQLQNHSLVLLIG